MYMMPTNISEIKKCLQALKSNTPGVDEISPRILQHVNEALAVPLTHIVNLSLKHGIFPDHLKKAKVIPIYKAGNRCDISNYRPISILPAFSKVYEKIIANRLINYLEKNNLLTTFPHFSTDFEQTVPRKALSCILLIVFINFWKKNISWLGFSWICQRHLIH